MVINLVLLTAGFLALIKGADVLVDSAVLISRRSGLSELLIGLTIVAFGTSLPELAVSISAALKDSGIAVGNVLGSNVANIALVLGIGSLILPVKVSRASIIYEIPFVLFSSVVVSMLLLLRGSALTRFDGAILLCLFVIFLAYAGKMAIGDYSKNSFNTTHDSGISSHGLAKPFLLTIMGIAGVVIGSELVVRSGTSVALFFGVSETLVGLTVVAIGTSLPELVTTIAAGLKKSGALAFGNLLGSNIMNLLLVLGLASIVSPIVADRSVLFEIIFMIGSVLLLIPLCLKDRQFGRVSGFLLLFVYIAFVFTTIVSG